MILKGWSLISNASPAGRDIQKNFSPDFGPQSHATFVGSKNEPAHFLFEGNGITCPGLGGWPTLRGSGQETQNPPIPEPSQILTRIPLQMAHKCHFEAPGGQDQLWAPQPGRQPGSAKSRSNNAQTDKKNLKTVSS